MTQFMKPSPILESLKQPFLQVIFYVLIYEVIIMNFISEGFIKMNLALGITAIYLFYLYVILSLVLFLMTYLLKMNRFINSVILIIFFFVISFYSVKDSQSFALLIWANVAVSTFVSYFIISKFNQK